MRMEIVSVIVPVYNCEMYIEKCLQSILNQTYGNIEVLVFNDGSYDNSGNIIESFACKDIRIRYFNQENKGVSYCRNKGIREAMGKYITFVDGDDYLDASYVEELVKAVESSDGDFSFCGYRMVDTQEHVLYSCTPTIYKAMVHEEWAYKIVSICARLYKRDFIIKEKMNFDESRSIRGEDVPFSLWANARGKAIQVVSKPLYNYVQHSSSAMHNFQGLKKFDLPWKAFDYLCSCMQNQRTNSQFFFQLGIFRAYAVFLFQLTTGAEKDKIKYNCDFVYTSVRKYFPDYKKNPYLKMFNNLELPVIEKIEICIFTVLLRMKILEPMITVLSWMINFKAFILRKGRYGKNKE